MQLDTEAGERGDDDIRGARLFLGAGGQLVAVRLLLFQRDSSPHPSLRINAPASCSNPAVACTADRPFSTSHASHSTISARVSMKAVGDARSRQLGLVEPCVEPRQRAARHLQRRIQPIRLGHELRHPQRQRAGGRLDAAVCGDQRVRQQDRRGTPGRRASAPRSTPACISSGMKVPTCCAIASNTGPISSIGSVSTLMCPPMIVRIFGPSSPHPLDVGIARDLLQRLRHLLLRVAAADQGVREPQRVLHARADAAAEHVDLRVDAGGDGAHGAAERAQEASLQLAPVEGRARAAEAALFLLELVVALAADLARSRCGRGGPRRPGACRHRKRPRRPRAREPCARDPFPSSPAGQQGRSAAPAFGCLCRPARCTPRAEIRRSRSSGRPAAMTAPPNTPACTAAVFPSAPYLRAESAECAGRTGRCRARRRSRTPEPSDHVAPPRRAALPALPEQLPDTADHLARHVAEPADHPERALQRAGEAPSLSPREQRHDRVSARSAGSGRRATTSSCRRSSAWRR